MLPLLLARTCGPLLPIYSKAPCRATACWYQGWTSATIFVSSQELASTWNAANLHGPSVDCTVAEPVIGDKHDDREPGQCPDRRSSKSRHGREGNKAAEKACRRGGIWNIFFCLLLPLDSNSRTKLYRYFFLCQHRPRLRRALANVGQSESRPQCMRRSLWRSAIYYHSKTWVFSLVVRIHAHTIN